MFPPPGKGNFAMKPEHRVDSTEYEPTNDPEACAGEGSQGNAKVFIQQSQNTNHK